MSIETNEQLKNRVLAFCTKSSPGRFRVKRAWLDTLVIFISHADKAKRFQNLKADGFYG